MDIEANLAAFTGDRTSTARYASFDYCFNYFQSFREQDRVAGVADAFEVHGGGGGVGLGTILIILLLAYLLGWV